MHNRRWPKEAQPVEQHQEDEPGHHKKADGQCPSSEPDEGVTALPEALHRERYLCRSFRRTSSARVFTRNVITKSRRAARKRTRKSVPPSGASGSSTAILADSARKPLKILQSMTGVLPVAISTIIVSPTARPKPIMIAEKIPELAVGSTTLMAVCQRVAPRASAPATRCCGTLARESSAMVKMIGIMAKPMAKPTTREFRWS